MSEIPENNTLQRRDPPQVPVYVLVIFGCIVGIGVIALEPRILVWLLAAAVWIGLAALYLLPTIAGNLRAHPHKEAIAVLNILLGWTFIGWVAALVWAMT